MRTLLKKVKVYSDGSFETEVPKNTPVLYRVLHDIEMGGVWRPELPEVHPFLPNHYARFTEAWQRRSKDLNPKFSNNKWTAAYHYRLWITNYNGFGDSKDKRANYITRENLTYKDPQVELLTCGGNILTGTVEGTNLIVTPLSWRDTPPTTQWLLDNPWYITYAVSSDANGVPRRFPANLQPDGSYEPFRHILLGDPTSYPRITFPLNKLEKWERDYLPNPYAIYS